MPQSTVPTKHSLEGVIAQVTDMSVKKSPPVSNPEPPESPQNISDIPAEAPEVLKQRQALLTVLFAFLTPRICEHRKMVVLFLYSA